MDEVLQIPPSLLTCGGCQQNIGDRYFLKAIDQYWHEDCLSCDLCGCRLGEVGRRLYYKLGRKLCRRDYLRYSTLRSCLLFSFSKLSGTNLLIIVQTQTDLACPGRICLGRLNLTAKSNATGNRDKVVVAESSFSTQGPQMRLF